MKLANALAYKTLSSTAPGEMSRLSYARGSALGLTLAATEKGIAIGVLSFNFQLTESEGAFQPPFSILLPARTSCLSHGSDWVLDPCPSSEMFIESRHFTERSGAIHFTADGPILTLRARDDFMAGPSGFNLTTSTLGSTPSSGGAACLSWKIWASEEDRRSAAADPLMTFSTPDDRR